MANNRTLVYDCINCGKRWTIFAKDIIHKGIYCWECNELMPGATHIINHYNNVIDQKLEMLTKPESPPFIH